MKINPKRLRQILANSFILITAVTFVSCTQVNGDKLPMETAQPKSEIVQTITDSEVVIEDTITIPSVVVTMPTTIEIKQLEEKNEEVIPETTIEEAIPEVTVNKLYSFIDESIDLSCINNPTDYFIDNIEQLFSFTSLTNEQQILAMYAYKKLVLANISPEVFEIELNNMMIEQIMPRGMDDEDWEEYFGTLSGTLNEEESLGDTYIIMAFLLHNEYCTDEHSYDYGIIKCKSLVNQFNDRYSK